MDSKFRMSDFSRIFFSSSASWWKLCSLSFTNRPKCWIRISWTQLFLHENNKIYESLKISPIWVGTWLLYSLHVTVCQRFKICDSRWLMRNTFWFSNFSTHLNFWSNKFSILRFVYSDLIVTTLTLQLFEKFLISWYSSINFVVWQYFFNGLFHFSWRIVPSILQLGNEYFIRPCLVPTYSHDEK